jgi:hypothetical protein
MLLAGAVHAARKNSGQVPPGVQDEGYKTLNLEP